MLKKVFLSIILILAFVCSGVMITEQQKQITNLETQLETQEKTYSGRIDELTAYQQTLVVQLDELTSQNAKLKEQVQTLQNEYNELEDLISTDDPVNKIEKLNATIASMEEEINNLQATIDEQEETIDRLTSDLNSDIANIVDNSTTTLTAENFKGVTSIRPYAFYNMPFLTSVVIPSNVKEIMYSAFYMCTGLEYVYIDAEYMYPSAFDLCGIDVLEFGPNVKKLDYYAFDNCLICSLDNPNTLTIPNEFEIVANRETDLYDRSVFVFDCLIFEGKVNYSYFSNTDFTEFLGHISVLNYIVVPEEYYDFYYEHFSQRISDGNFAIASSKTLSDVLIIQSQYEANIA